MSATCQRRITKELAELNRNPVEGVTITVDESDMHIWNIVMAGPANSPYKGGSFKVKVVFPETYPFKAPALTFLTKVYHPGINEEGQICVQVLGAEWKPTVTMSNVLHIVYDKLANPSPEDPYEAEIAALLKSDKAKFTSTAKEWTKK
ncbi:UBC-like protein [Serendipita vermifera]|nr:UBC-like protein [Serendipita vermifera]